MKIIIWDSTAGRCTANRTVIESAALELRIAVEVQVWTEPLAPKNGTLGNHCDLLLLHAPTDENVAMSWFESKAIAVPLVLRYSGGGSSGGVPRAVSDRDPLNQFEATGILEAARDTSTQKAFLDRLLAIWTAFPINLLAFRLLCEAWEEVNVKGNASLSGFPITAPSGLPDWVAPFSTQSDGSTATANSVVALMENEDTKSRVEAVLNAADCNPEKAVLAFLGRTDLAAAAQGDVQQ